MNNLLSYCGLVDARISASEKDLPVYMTLGKTYCSQIHVEKHQMEQSQKIFWSEYIHETQLILLFHVDVELQTTAFLHEGLKTIAFRQIDQKLLMEVFITLFGC